MDILTSLPFDIKFIVLKNGEIDNEKSYEVFELYSRIDISNQKIPKFTEYDYLKVSFCNKENQSILNARLFMSCFEFVSEENLNIEYNIENYIPIDNEAVIHTFEHNNQGIPLIPGIYHYRVEVEDDKYFGQFEVTPRNVSKDIHNKMIYDIETTSLGLARDFLRGGIGISPNDFDLLNVDKSFILSRNHKKIVKALNTIKSNPIERFEKKYPKKKINNRLKFNEKSVKLNVTKNINIINKYSLRENKKVYILQNKLIKETEENNYVYSSLNKYISIYEKGIKELQMQMKYIKNEIDTLDKYQKNLPLLNSRIEILNKLKNDLSNFNRNKHYLRSMKKEIYYGLKFNRFNIKVTNKLIRTEGYRDIYNIDKIISSHLNVNILNYHNFKWKATDVLYEYWCFIKLITIIKELEFEPIDGWIYDIRNNKLIVPSIPDGSEVVFIKNDLSLNLIFNKAINRNINMKDPYWIRHHRNKPDFRMDIYQNNEYKKTIILDSKYSPADKIWKRNGFTKVVEQLNIYKNMVVSSTNVREHVVDEVIALTPTTFKNGELINFDEYYFVTVATLSPECESDYLIERLKKHLYY